MANYIDDFISGYSALLRRTMWASNATSRGDLKAFFNRLEGSVLVIHRVIRLEQEEEEEIGRQRGQDFILEYSALVRRTMRASSRVDLNALFNRLEESVQAIHQMILLA